MSQIMMGVLTMPDDMFWADDPMSRYQHNQVRLKAAKRIRELESINTALYEALLVAMQSIDPANYTDLTVCNEALAKV